MNVPELTVIVASLSGAVAGVATAADRGLPVRCTTGIVGLIVGFAIGVACLLWSERFKNDGAPIPTPATSPLAYFFVIPLSAVVGTACASVLFAKLLMMGLDAL